MNEKLDHVYAKDTEQKEIDLVRKETGILPRQVSKSATSTITVKILQKQIENLEAEHAVEIGDLLKKIAALEADKELTRKKTTAIQKKVRKIESVELMEAKDLIVDLRRQLMQRELTGKHALNQVDLLRAEINELLSQLANSKCIPDCKEEIAKLNGELAKAKESQNHLNNESKALSLRVMEEKKSREYFQFQCEKLQKNVESFEIEKTKYSRLNAKNTEQMEEEMAILEVKLAEYAKNIEKNYTPNADILLLREAYHNEKSLAETNLQKAIADLESKNAEIIGLRDKNDDLNTMVSQLQEKLIEQKSKMEISHKKAQGVAGAELMDMKELVKFKRQALLEISSLNEEVSLLSNELGMLKYNVSIKDTKASQTLKSIVEAYEDAIKLRDSTSFDRVDEIKNAELKEKLEKLAFTSSLRETDLQKEIHELKDENESIAKDFNEVKANLLLKIGNLESELANLKEETQAEPSKNFATMKLELESAQNQLLRLSSEKQELEIEYELAMKKLQKNLLYNINEESVEVNRGEQASENATYRSKELASQNAQLQLELETAMGIIENYSKESPDQISEENSDLRAKLEYYEIVVKECVSVLEKLSEKLNNSKRSRIPRPKAVISTKDFAFSCRDMDSEIFAMMAQKDVTIRELRVNLQELNSKILKKNHKIKALLLNSQTLAEKLKRNGRFVEKIDQLDQKLNSSRLSLLSNGSIRASCDMLSESVAGSLNAISMSNSNMREKKLSRSNSADLAEARQQYHKELEILQLKSNYQDILQKFEDLENAFEFRVKDRTMSLQYDLEESNRNMALLRLETGSLKCEREKVKDEIEYAETKLYNSLQIIATVSVDIDASIQRLAIKKQIDQKTNQSNHEFGKSQIKKRAGPKLSNAEEQLKRINEICDKIVHKFDIPPIDSDLPVAEAVLNQIGLSFSALRKELKQKRQENIEFYKAIDLLTATNSALAKENAIIEKLKNEFEVSLYKQEKVVEEALAAGQQFAETFSIIQIPQSLPDFFNSLNSKLSLALKSFEKELSDKQREVESLKLSNEAQNTELKNLNDNLMKKSAELDEANLAINQWLELSDALEKERISREKYILTKEMEASGFPVLDQNSHLVFSRLKETEKHIAKLHSEVLQSRNTGSLIQNSELMPQNPNATSLVSGSEDRHCILTGKNEDLKPVGSQIEGNATKLEYYANEIEKLKEENRILADRLNSSERKVDFQLACQQLSKELETVRESLSAEVAEKEESQRIFASKISDMEMLSKKLREKYQLETQQLQIKIDESQKKIVIYEDELSVSKNLRQRLKQLQEKIHELKSQSSCMNLQHGEEELQTTLLNYKTLVSSLYKKIDLYSSQISELTSKLEILSNAEQEKNNLLIALETVNQDKVAQEMKLIASEDELIKHRECFKSDLDAKDLKISKLEAEAEVQKELVENLKASQMQAATDIGVIEQYESLTLSLKEKYEKLLLEGERVNKERISLKIQLQKAAEELSLKEESLHSLENSLLEALNKNENYFDQIKKLKDEICILKSKNLAAARESLQQESCSNNHVADSLDALQSESMKCATLILDQKADSLIQSQKTNGSITQNDVSQQIMDSRRSDLKGQITANVILKQGQASKLLEESLGEESAFRDVMMKYKNLVNVLVKKIERLEEDHFCMKVAKIKLGQIGLKVNGEESLSTLFDSVIDRVDQLQREYINTINTLRSDKESLQYQLINCESELKSVKFQKVSLNGVVSSLENKLEERKSNSNFLQSKLNEETNLKEQALTSLGIEKEKNFAIQAELNSKLEQLKNEKEALNSSLKDYELSDNQIRETCEVIKCEKLALEEEKTKLLAYTQNLEIEFGKAKKSVEIAELQVKNSDISAEAANKVIAALEKEKSDICHKCEVLEEEIEKLNTDLRNLELEAKAIKDALAQSHLKVEQLEISFGKANTTIKGLQDEKLDDEEKRKILNEEKIKLIADMTNLDLDYSAVKESLRQSRLKSEKDEETLTTISAAIVTLQNEKQEIQEECSTLHHKIAKLEKQLELAHRHSLQLEEIIEKGKKNIESIKISHQNQFDVLKLERDALVTAKEKLARKVEIMELDLPAFVQQVQLKLQIAIERIELSESTNEVALNTQKCLETQVMSLKDELQKKEQHFQKLISNTEERIKQNSKVQELTLEVKSLIKEKEREVSNLIAEKEDLALELKSLSTKMKEQERCISNLKSENEDLALEMKSISSKSNNQEHSISNLKSEKDLVRTFLKSLGANLDVALEDNEDMCSHIRIIFDKMRDSIFQIQRAQTSDLLVDLELEKTMVLLANLQVKYLQKEISSKQAEIDHLEKSLLCKISEVETSISKKVGEHDQRNDYLKPLQVDKDEIEAEIARSSCKYLNNVDEAEELKSFLGLIVDKLFPMSGERRFHEYCRLAGRKNKSSAMIEDISKEDLEISKDLRKLRLHHIRHRKI